MTVVDSWKNTDPRDEHPGYCYIAIARPGPDTGKTVVGLGHVYTYEGWDIFTDFPDHKHIDVDDKWDAAWWWVPIPSALR